MKKLILLSVVILIASTILHAQINKGQWLAGGAVGFTYSHSSSSNPNFTHDDKATSLQAAPGAGYFVINKLAVGLRAALSTANITLNQTSSFMGQNNVLYYSKTTSTNYAVAPFVRYYFLPATKKLNILCEATYGYGHSKSTSVIRQLQNINGVPNYYEYKNDSKANLSSYSLSAGAALFITRNTALELLAGFDHTKNGDVSQNSVAVTAGFQIHFGK